MVVSVVQRRMVVNVVQDESNCSTVNNNKSIHLDRDTWIVPGHMPTGHIPTGRQTSARVWETLHNSNDNKTPLCMPPTIDKQAENNNSNSNIVFSLVWLGFLCFFLPV